MAGPARKPTTSITPFYNQAAAEDSRVHQGDVNCAFDPSTILANQKHTVAAALSTAAEQMARFSPIDPNPILTERLKKVEPHCLRRRLESKTISGKITETFLDRREVSSKGFFPLRQLCLYGEEGLGKKEAALFFLYKYREQFSFVFWFDCQTFDSLVKSYCSLPEGFNMPILEEYLSLNSEVDFELLRAFVHSALENIIHEKPWMAVFANYDRSYPLTLPKHGGGILVTSRDPVFDRAEDNVRFRPFTHPEGRNFFDLYDWKGDEYALRSLIDLIGGYPMVLCQLGAIVEKGPGINTDTVLKELKDKALFNRADRSWLKILDQKTWLSFFWELIRTCLLDVDIDFLAFCAFNHPEPVSVRIIELYLGDKSFAKNKCEAMVDRMISTAEGFSIMQFRNDQLFMHPLQAKVILEFEKRKRLDQAEADSIRCKEMIIIAGEEQIQKAHWRPQGRRPWTITNL